MRPVVFDHPVGHTRLYAPGTCSPRPAHIPPFDNVDPANYWRCDWCHVISRSWEAADTHTAKDHRAPAA